MSEFKRLKTSEKQRYPVDHEMVLQSFDEGVGKRRLLSLCFSVDGSVSVDIEFSNCTQINGLVYLHQ